MGNHTSYLPGGAYLGVDGRHLVWSPERDLVHRIWEAFRGGDDVAVVLASSVAAGLHALPDVLIIEPRGGKVEVLVRGEIEIRIAVDGREPITLDGRGVRTWREESFDAVTRISVGDAPTSGELDGGLPLHSGVVQAGAFILSHEALDATSQDAKHTKRGEPKAAAKQAAHSTQNPSDHPGTGLPGADLPGEATITAPEPATPQMPVAPPPPPPPPPSATDRPMAPPPPPPPPVTATATQLGPPDEFGHLFEQTIMRSPEDAAVRRDEDAETGSANEVDEATPQQLGDHDGATILGSQLSALLAASRQTDSRQTDSRQSASPQPDGSRPDARDADSIPADGGQAGGQGHQAAQPTSAPTQSAGNQHATLHLVFSTGQQVPVDGPVIIGRKPQADRVSGTEIPRLITVPSPNNDISRSHLEVRPNGNGLAVTDLGSTNGTTVIDSGMPRTLTAHFAEFVPAGARLDLGDGIVIDVQAAG